MLLAAVAMAAAPAAASSESSVVERAELDLALASRAERGESARGAIRELLAREEVRELAAGLGLDLRRVEAAIATLGPDELAALGGAARRASAELAGGQAPAVSGGRGVTLPLLYVLILLAVIVTIVLA